jgi:hypothetical protein
MKDVHFRARRIGAALRIEDTASGKLLEGRCNLFVLARRAAAKRERKRALAALARAVDEAGRPELAEDVRAAVPKQTLLRRLRACDEGRSEAAQILAAADDGLWS